MSDPTPVPQQHPPAAPPTVGAAAEPAMPRISPAYAPPYGYATPTLPQPPAAPAAERPRTLGLVAFLCALTAAILPPVAAVLAGFRIGAVSGASATVLPEDAAVDLSVFTPVRDWVLLGEIAFWVGTVLGVWALTQGIVAIARNQGRGFAVAAVVIAPVAAVLFGAALLAAFFFGAASAVL